MSVECVSECTGVCARVCEDAGARACEYSPVHVGGCGYLHMGVTPGGGRSEDRDVRGISAGEAGFGFRW